MYAHFVPELEPAEQVGNDGEVVGEHGHKELVPAESLRIRVSPRQSESSLRVRLIGLSGEELVRGPRSHRMIRSIKGALSESLLLPSAARLLHFCFKERQLSKIESLRERRYAMRSEHRDYRHRNMNQSSHNLKISWLRACGLGVSIRYPIVRRDKRRYSHEKHSHCHCPSPISIVRRPLP